MYEQKVLAFSIEYFSDHFIEHVSGVFSELFQEHFSEVELSQKLDVVFDIN